MGGVDDERIKQKRKMNEENLLTFSNEKDSEVLKINNDDSTRARRAKVSSSSNGIIATIREYKCQDCGRIFTSGRALGGHCKIH